MVALGLVILLDGIMLPTSLKFFHQTQPTRVIVTNCRQVGAWASSANDQEFLFVEPHIPLMSKIVTGDGTLITVNEHELYFVNSRDSHWYTSWLELSDDGTYAYTVGFDERDGMTFQIGEQISSPDYDYELFQHVSSVGLDNINNGTAYITTNFAFDRIRNRFYSYYYNKVFGIDVSDPTNPIVQTVDLDGFAHDLSGVVLSPDGTTLYVGVNSISEDNSSLLTILTSSLFPPGGGEVGNPTPGPLPNPEGPISGTLNSFNAMPQVVSTDGRWLYGLREVRRIGVDFIQIVTLDLQSAIHDESEFFQGGVNSNLLTYNELKEESIFSLNLVSESLLPQTIHLILNTLEVTIRVC